MGYTFSQQNGMGPIPIYPQCQPNKPSQFSDALRLLALSANLTILAHADSMYSLSAVHKIVKSSFTRYAFVTYYIFICLKKQK